MPKEPCADAECVNKDELATLRRKAAAYDKALAEVQALESSIDDVAFKVALADKVVTRITTERDTAHLALQDLQSILKRDMCCMCPNGEKCWPYDKFQAAIARGLGEETDGPDRCDHCKWVEAFEQSLTDTMKQRDEYRAQRDSLDRERNGFVDALAEAGQQLSTAESALSHERRKVEAAVDALSDHICPTIDGYKPTCLQKRPTCKGCRSARKACWSDYLDQRAKEAEKHGNPKLAECKAIYEALMDEAGRYHWEEGV